MKPVVLQRPMSNAPLTPGAVAPVVTRRRQPIRRVRLIAVILALVLLCLWLKVVDSSVGPGSRKSFGVAGTVRPVAVAPVRGSILGADGTALVTNVSTTDIVVDRSELAVQPQGGRATIDAVAKLLGVSSDALWGATRTCGESGAPAPPACFGGTPYQPIPVAKDVAPQVALQLIERPELYPGVTVQQAMRRHYPVADQYRAAHVLGYLGPAKPEDVQVSAQEGARQLSSTWRLGRSGLERSYDGELRGRPGLNEVKLSPSGRVLTTTTLRDPQPGHHLITTIEPSVQRAVEQSLAAAAAQSGHTTAASGAAVVLDADTGSVVATASHPDYDPTLWASGISAGDYENLTRPGGGSPLVNRVVQGQYPPASTIKPLSLTAAALQGVDVTAPGDCSATFTAGNREFANYGRANLGMLTMAQALTKSCDTIFYRFAAQDWQRNQSEAVDIAAQAADAAGFGKSTGIDLPEEAAGRYPDRRTYADGAATRQQEACAAADAGYPQVRATDPARADELVRAARTVCSDARRWNIGDAVNRSIGQGEVLVTPLQLARYYAAIANGGKVLQPHLLRAVVAADGKLIRERSTATVSTLNLPDPLPRIIDEGLRGVTGPDGTAGAAFAGWRSDQPIAGKTGTAQVDGKADTSWFVAYNTGPGRKYVVAVVIPDAGFGGVVAGPAVRRIFDAIFDPAQQAANRPLTELPGTLPNGVVIQR